MEMLLPWVLQDLLSIHTGPTNFKDHFIAVGPEKGHATVYVYVYVGTVDCARVRSRRDVSKRVAPTSTSLLSSALLVMKVHSLVAL
ncbi:hypothetical protein J6590_012757 [Homalodisca vitripennis]|nr:hypothetical protein J6590_012757 [Homalodisca vitripennis]